MKQAIKTLIEALFRVLFTYDCIGQEKVPATGPAVIAANHPSYLDPFLLGLQVRRPIHFMAWDAWFKVPLVGALMRIFDAFPVDVRKGKGREAYEKAKGLLRSGEVVGIFPEGKRSRTGWLEPALREGAARLAWETGAPLIPATIAGAYRAWPHYQSLPRPARIRVRYHEPIDPGPWRGMGEDDALPALLAELRRRVERSLLPGVKADLRMNVLYRLPSPWPRTYESAPVLALALLVFWKTRSLLAVAPAWAYVAYLLLDHFVIPQSKLAKWIRNSSPVLFLFAYGRLAFARDHLERDVEARLLVAREPDVSHSPRAQRPHGSIAAEDQLLRRRCTRHLEALRGAHGRGAARGPAALRRRHRLGAQDRLLAVRGAAAGDVCCGQPVPFPGRPDGTGGARDGWSPGLAARPPVALSAAGARRGGAGGDRPGFAPLKP